MGCMQTKEGGNDGTLKDSAKGDDGFFAKMPTVDVNVGKK